MMIIYHVLYFIAFVFYFPVLLVRGKLHKGFIQRLGFIGHEFTYRLYQKSNIWFHAVSVGEVIAIVGLVDKIRVEYPTKQMVITTVTKTGYAIAKKRFKKEDVVLYAPLDFGWSVEAFIKVIKPEIFIVAETELWPSLLNALVKSDVPVVMVNGRISDKSFYHYRKLLFFFEKVIHRFRGFCMQNVKDADRIIALGGLPKNVMVVGSMKFDDVVCGDMITPEQLGFPNDAMILVAGSTYPGEEKIILGAFKKLKVRFPSLCMILAPRHVERADELMTLVKSVGSTAQKFPIARSTPFLSDVVVVDTIGYLKSLYRLATVVFVGKSLIGNGGQNIIEPAFFGKPIIVGPNMQNFADITEVFLVSRAIIQIQKAEELDDAIARLLLSLEMRQSFGERARLTVQKNQGATVRTQKVVSAILNATSFVRPT